jgi:hypothetical protein
MHADSLDEALTLLRDELRAGDADLAGMTVYLQYSAYRTPAGMYRRVEEAWHLRTDATGRLAAVRLAELAGGRSPSLTGAQRLPVPPTLSSDGGRSRRDLVHDPEAYAVLAASLGLDAEALEREIAERVAFLAGLEERGLCGPAEVALAASHYPNQPPLPARPESRTSQGASA